MAICANCGKEIRDDVWTCGFCGATVAQPAAAGPGAPGGAAHGTTPYGTPVPQSAPTSSGGLSQVTKLALVGAVVAVVAIVAVWFFVLRGQGGEQFVGTWTAVENGQGGLVVERGDDGLQVVLLGGGQERVGPLKCELDGDDLEIKLEAAGGSADDKAAVDVVRALFQATVEDFRMVLSVRDADGRLLLTVSGKAKGGGEATTLPPTEFVRAGTTPAP